MRGIIMFDFLDPDHQPKWAKRMERRIMATVKEQLDRLVEAIAPMGAALEGISGDLVEYAAKAERDAAEIASLKAAVEAAQGGTLSDEDLQRFDALVASLNEASAKAKELDDKLPNVPPVEPPTE